MGWWSEETRWKSAVDRVTKSINNDSFMRFSSQARRRFEDMSRCESVWTCARTSWNKRAIDSAGWAPNFTSLRLLHQPPLRLFIINCLPLITAFFIFSLNVASVNKSAKIKRFHYALVRLSSHSLLRANLWLWGSCCGGVKNGYKRWEQRNKIIKA